MKCFKCGSLLLLDRYGRNKNEKEYYCIGCSSYGTTRDMEIQALFANLMRDSLTHKIKCKICGRDISTSEAKIIKYNYSQTYACKMHKENKI